MSEQVETVYIFCFSFYGILVFCHLYGIRGSTVLLGL